MRLIDADALEEEFRKELDQVRTMNIPEGEEQYWDGYDEGICNGWVMVSEDGRFAPTIEAISVVRCECDFGKNHEQGDMLYESSDWDGGIGFDYIRDIKYCPLCGGLLGGEREDG